MSENFELQLISYLLAHPNELAFSNMEPDWFQMFSLKTTVESLVSLKDVPNWSIEDLRRMIVSKDIFNGLKKSELEMLRDGCTNEYDLEQLERLVKGDYLERELKKTYDGYLSGKMENAHKLQEVLYELDTLKVPKESGELEASEQDIIEHLTKETDHEFIKSYPKLDECLGGGILDGQLIVIGSRPAAGKSAFAISLSQKIMEKAPSIHIDFFALEMTKREMIYRYLANESGVELKKIKNPSFMLFQERKLGNEAWERLKKKNLRIFGRNHSGLSSLASEISKKAKQCKEIGVKYIPIIDQATLVQANIKRAGIREQYIEITRTIKRLTIEFDIPIILLTQLKRPSDKKDDFKEPTNSDFKESSSFEEDANITILLWKSNQQDKSETKVMIAKNRDGVNGYPLDFKFNSRYMQFTEEF